MDSKLAPKKLAIIRPTMGQGGADRVTLTLLQNLPRQCFTPLLVLVQGGREYMHELPQDVPVSILNTSNILLAVAPLVNYLRAQRPDILFSTSSGTNITAVLASKLAGTRNRIVLSERNVLLHGSIRPKKKILLALKRALYNFADEITAVSEGVKDDLV